MPNELFGACPMVLVIVRESNSLRNGRLQEPSPWEDLLCFETLGLLTLPLRIEDMPAVWPLVLLQFCNTDS